MIKELGIILAICSVALLPLGYGESEANEVIVIVGAMDSEVRPILDQMNVTKEYTFQTSAIWEGTLYGKEVVLARCGVGQKKAESCTQFLMNNYNIRAIIFSGTGGSISTEAEIGDVVVSSSVLCLDSLSIKEYPTDEKLSLLAMNNSFEFDVYQGKFYTATLILVDEFILFPYLRTRNVKCLEMENAPMAKLTMENRIPFISIRGLSDQGGRRSSSVAYLLGLPCVFLDAGRYTQLAADHAAAVTLELVQRM